MAQSLSRFDYAHLLWVKSLKGENNLQSKDSFLLHVMIQVFMLVVIQTIWSGQIVAACVDDWSSLFGASACFASHLPKAFL